MTKMTTRPCPWRGEMGLLVYVGGELYGEDILMEREREKMDPLVKREN